MASVKILHTADWHFDSAFSALSKEKARERKTHLFQTLDKMISLAKAEAVDAFLVAGDLFDGESASVVTAKTVFEKLGTLAPIPVFIAAGNHDPYDGKSFYHTLPLPENVHVFSAERMEKVELLPDVNIYGRSFSKRYEKGLLDGFSAEPGKLSLMVLHGDVGGGEEYNPIAPRAISESSISYLALGHIHKRSEVECSGSTFYAYPGSPEGRGFDECGPMGALIGTVSDGGADMKFVPLSEHHYLEKELDVTPFLGEEQIRTAIEDIIRKEGNEHLYKIVLKGTLEEEISLKNLTESFVNSPYFIKIQNKTSYSLNLRNDSPLSQKMRTIIEESEEEDEIKELALYYALLALSGKEADVLETQES